MKIEIKIKFIMKTKLLLPITMLLLTFILATNCKKKEDETTTTPPTTTPIDTTSSGLTPNITISEIKSLYNNLLVIDGDIKKFTDTNLILEATVISTDQYNNFYKELYIQDQTGGIVLNIDKGDIYLDYNIGQTVHIKLYGLNIYYCDYKNIFEIGYSIYDNNGEQQLGRIPSDKIKDYIICSGTPSAPSSKEITLDNSTNLDNNVGLLVKINSAQFIDPDLNKTYADADGLNSQSLNIETCLGTSSIILRTSGYADFADIICPSGNGVITAVLTKYGSNYQLIINNYSDVNFTNDRCENNSYDEGTGSGTIDDPYDVEAAIYNNNTATSVWVKGFLVGVIETGGTDYISSLTAPFSTPYNVYISESANETDTSKMLIIQLPAGDIRNNTNLADNNSLLGSEIMYHGDLLDYYAMPGMRNTNGYWLNGAGIDPDLPANIVIIGTSQIVSSLNETFDNSTPEADYNLNGWLNANKQGEKYWISKEYLSENNKYIQFSGYGATYSTLESWLVSPGITASTNKKISFRTKTGYYKHDALTVYISTDFDGNNSDLFTSTWTDITSNFTIATGPTDGYGSWVVSGDADLSAYTGSTIYIMFKYLGDNSTNTTTIQIDDILITDL